MTLTSDPVVIVHNSPLHIYLHLFSTNVVTHFLSQPYDIRNL